ncbi:MAG: tetratricopeptide repeat protein, partial [Candidatus Limnocylindria bacterium]
ALAERAEPHLVAANEAGWATRLQAERANARVALEWSATHDAEVGLRIAAAMWRFWEYHGAIAEGHAWLERLLTLPGEPGLVRAKGLEAASRFAAYVGKYDIAHRHISAALAIVRRTHDRGGIARVLHEIGSLALFEGKLPEARRRLEAALTMRRELGDAWGIANTLSNLGLVAACEGDLERAEALLREGLTTYENLNERFKVAGALGNLAEITRLRGRLDDARSYTLSGLRLAQEFGDTDGVAGSFDSLAKLSNATSNYARAVRLFGLASALRDEAGTTPPVIEREELERELSIARAGVNPATFDAEWQAGRQMTVEAALEPWMTP